MRGNMAAPKSPSERILYLLGIASILQDSYKKHLREVTDEYKSSIDMIFSYIQDEISKLE